MQYVLDLLLRFFPSFRFKARQHDCISKDSAEGQCSLEPEGRVSSAERAQDHAHGAVACEPFVAFTTPAFLFQGKMGIIKQSKALFFAKSSPCFNRD